MRFGLVLVSVFTGLSVFAQDELDMPFWSDVMINANVASHREYALAEFREDFAALVESGKAFSYDYSLIPEVSVLSDTMSTFKLLSWQIAGKQDSFSYYGYLVKSDGQVYELQDAFDELEDIEYVQVGPEEWIGGIYYNIVEQGDQYFLFSYRQLDEYTKFKSFDVLSFNADGSPVLGAEVFVKPMNESRDIVKNRVVFTYSSDAILSLNYNPEMNMVVHDHLMEVIGQREGQGPTKVPDGTYEGYLFKEGKWVYEEKLFHHTYDEAPRPQQILGKSNKDVFGKERKN